MAEAPDRLLKLLAEKGDGLTTLEVARVLNISHQEAVGACKSLETDQYIELEKKDTQEWKLSDEAIKICEKGSPEYALWCMLESGPMPQAKVDELLKADAKIAVSNGMKQKLFVFDKSGSEALIKRNPATPKFEDMVQGLLRNLAASKHVDPTDADALKKRKLASLETVKFFVVKKGKCFAVVRQARAVGDFTQKMLFDGSWEKLPFKQYNFNAAGKEPEGGQLHPLLKVRQEFREIFLELGFQEMETQQFVESSFWNFDALFVPQRHPARDTQDTFFTSKPECSKPPPKDYVEAVRKVHENGYVCDWSEYESSRNVLRTHTTGNSGYALYHLAQRAGILPDGRRNFKPGRYFSIDRVFRNEEMDKTHLCEFHQIEGFIIDRNVSLANMMYTLNQFFRRIGIERLRFKPAYNPYTEPSMEIFGYHSGLQKWMEVGNSGVFRPEMLEPMGFDKDVTAIAWGLSLERPTMIKYNIRNIHELFGHKVDLKFIRKSKIARY